MFHLFAICTSVFDVKLLPQCHRLIIRDVMLEDEGEYTAKAVDEAGTCH